MRIKLLNRAFSKFKALDVNYIGTNMKRKRMVASRKMCERKKRLTDHIEGLRKRFKELEREEEEFRIVVLKKVSLSSNKLY